MSNNTISIDDTVFNICSKHPDIKKIMASLGFTDIVKPGMINTAGRVMTIRKGAKMKKIDLILIKEKFEEKGFIIEI